MPVKKDVPRPQAAAEADSGFGVLFEMESLAFRGRKAMYDACERVLNQKKIGMDPAGFRRFFLDCPLDKALSRLIASEGRKTSAEKLTDEIGKQYAENMAKKSNLAEARFASAMSEAAAQKFSLGALSFLAEELACQLAARILPDAAISVLTARAEVGGLSTRDCWLGLAKKAGVNPRKCLALVSSAASCRTALAAGMRCVALPDEFTEFQDFAGADLVIESSEEISAARLFKLARSKTVSFR